MGSSRSPSIQLVVVVFVLAGSFVASKASGSVVDDLEVSPNKLGVDSPFPCPSSALPASESLRPRPATAGSTHPDAIVVSWGKRRIYSTEGRIDVVPRLVLRHLIGDSSPLRRPPRLAPMQLVSTTIGHHRTCTELVHLYIAHSTNSMTSPHSFLRRASTTPRSAFTLV